MTGQDSCPKDEGALLSGAGRSDIPSEESLEELVLELQRRGLIGIFLFLIEAHRPLRGMAGHLMTMSSPLLVAFFGASKVMTIQRIIEDDRSFAQFTQRLESMYQDSYGS